MELNGQVFGTVNIIKAKFVVFYSPSQPELYMKNALLQMPKPSTAGQITHSQLKPTHFQAPIKASKHTFTSPPHTSQPWKNTVTSPKKRDLSPKSLDITPCDLTVIPPFTMENTWKWP
jgi:hypothetical protein